MRRRLYQKIIKIIMSLGKFVVELIRFRFRSLDLFGVWRVPCFELKDSQESPSQFLVGEFLVVYGG